MSYYGKYFIQNGETYTIDKLNESLLDKGPSVYEVIRVLSGSPLFLEEHIERLQNSLVLLNSTYTLPLNSLFEAIKELININESPDQNIKIIINELSSPNPNTYIFFIPSSYPAKEQYEKGESAILFSSVRDNPNAKVVAKEQRELINLTLKERGVYEALLVDNEGYITEGSRSNVFFVKEDTVYTPPANKVLEGITRKRVLGLCKDLDINVIEENISKNSLHKMDAIFLTGTSPKVLPITIIDDIIFDSSNNPTVLRLMEAYNNLINDYIEKNR